MIIGLYCFINMALNLGVSILEVDGNDTTVSGLLIETFDPCDVTVRSHSHLVMLICASSAVRSPLSYFYLGKIVRYIGKIVQYIWKIEQYIGKIVSHIGKIVPYIGKILPYIILNIVPYTGKIVPYWEDSTILGR